MTLMVGPNKLQQFVTEKFKSVEKALGKKIGGIAGTLGKFGLNMGEGNLVIGVGKNKAETVMVSSTEVVGAGKATTVGGGYQLVVGGIHNQSIGIGSYEEVGQNKATVVGKLYEITVGDSKILMSEKGIINVSGKQITIEASETINIEAKNSITMKAGKINLN
ncbi:hypothetical protein PsAD2_03758 [Pseudovibrio axinellae]|uniref:Phage-related baseplate assembly protein n=1 Tax=Pseudovibrio axinellae TaxID=989403 RepID=A0A161V7D6_9HYPH|nr:hypothetical protein PsAD2_03758 [Pseudovibrio axinellae]SER89837.1 hypothetical protein SAMN05421798_1547 [Pseudovibrio axinellae]